MEPINFATGSWEIGEDDTTRLDRLIVDLADDQTRLTVEGHTDSTGDLEANQRLSERRAQTVVDYLVAAGISIDRLAAVGYGETRPMADNDTAEGRASNRRVEILIET